MRGQLRLQIQIVIGLLLGAHDHIIRQIREPTGIKNLYYELVL